MKSKSLLIFAVLAVVAVVLGLALRRSSRGDWGADAAVVGRSLLPDFPLNEVARITLAGPGRTLTLARKDGQWRVRERYGYPADWDRISQLVKQLANERVKQAITVGPKDYGRLDLLPPDADNARGAGTRVELLDASGGSLAALRLGKQHMADTGEVNHPLMRGQSFPDGRYILLGGGDGDEQVVLVANTFDRADPDPASWSDKQFLELRNPVSAELERDGETVWALESDPESDKLTLAGQIPEGMRVTTAAVSGTGGALAYATFVDVADPELSAAQTGMDSPAVYRAVNKDGVACTLRIGGKHNGNRYVQADVDYREPAKGSDDELEDADQLPPAETDESDDAAGIGDADEDPSEPDDIRRKVRELDERLDGWTYLLPENTVEKLLRERDDFLETLEEEEAGEDEDGAAAGETATAPASSDRGEDAATPPLPPLPPPPPHGE